MDRAITYVGALPRTRDFLGFMREALYGLGNLAQGVLGSATAVQGLVCSPTGPASLQVTVGAGAIYSPATVDATAYGPLGTDSNTVVKQGLLLNPATLTITPPATAGFSQIYLVQAAYNDVDSGAIVLPYFNSANPLQPLNGPNNAGTSQFTVRSGVCAISLKPGTAAATGSQVAPAVDVGYVGLYLITVSNGQTQITSGNIAIFAGAPFIPLTLPQVPPAIQVQTGNWAVDTGSANAMAIALPYGTVLTAGMPIRIKKSATASTGALTLSVNGGTAFPVAWEDGSPFVNAQWPANGVGEGIYDGTSLRMHGPIGPSLWQTVVNSAIVPFFSSTTWVVPAGVYYLKRLRIWGAGGGGGGASGVSLHGSGGGGGAYIETFGVPVTPGASITVTIGAGGAGGVGAAYGGAGGTSTFGSSTPYSCGGGAGGSDNSINAYGIGGTPSGGQMSMNGTHGTIGGSVSGDQIGGIGGAASFSLGSSPPSFSNSTGSSDGSDGSFPGCAGNGAATGTTGTAVHGGDGANGFIIVEY